MVDVWGPVQASWAPYRGFMEASWELRGTSCCTRLEVSRLLIQRITIRGRGKDASKEIKTKKEILPVLQSHRDPGQAETFFTVESYPTDGSYLSSAQGGIHVPPISPSKKIGKEKTWHRRRELRA